MKQIHSTPTTPFATIIDQVINDAFPPSVLKFASKGIPEVYALRILETPLVYLLNERRAQERLTGDTPEEQYLHFLEDRINASTELQERFPNHWKRWQQVKKCLIETINDVTRCAVEDTAAISELLHGSAHSEPPAIVSIKPLGDVHPQGMEAYS